MEVVLLAEGGDNCFRNEILQIEMRLSIVRLRFSLRLHSNSTGGWLSTRTEL